MTRSTPTGLGMVPMVIESPAGANAPTTSIPAAAGAHHLPGRAVNDQSANLVVAQMLFLESENPDKDISSTSTRRAAR